MITCVGHRTFPFRDPHSHHEQYPRISRYGDLFSFAYRRFTPPLVHGNPISFDGLYGSEIHHESLIFMDDDPMVYRVSIVDGTAKPSQSTKLIPTENMSEQTGTTAMEDSSLKGEWCNCLQNSNGSTTCVCSSSAIPKQHHNNIEIVINISNIIAVIIFILVLVYCFRLWKNPNPHCLKTHVLPLVIMFAMVLYILLISRK